MIPVIGTIQNAVKLSQMEKKWQMKKDNLSKKDKSSMTAEERQMLRFREQAGEIREGNKRANIDAKIKSGGTLTKEEMEYLKEKDPEAYRDYEDVKREKEAYEKQLKNCKTKEDVAKLKMTKLGNLANEAKTICENPNIPKEKKLRLVNKLFAKVVNDQQAYEKFVDSEEYKNLPTEEEENDSKKNQQGKPLETEPDTDTSAESGVGLEFEEAAQEIATMLEKEGLPEDRLDYLV